jgi:hypothetical protein
VPSTSPPTGFNPWTVQPVASRYTYSPITTHKTKKTKIKHEAGEEEMRRGKEAEKKYKGGEKKRGPKA